MVLMGATVHQKRARCLGCPRYLSTRRLMIASTPSGLFCEAGNFYIDPWEPVERAVVTHAHSDHARPGSRELPLRRAGRDGSPPPHAGRDRRDAAVRRGAHDRRRPRVVPSRRAHPRLCADPRRAPRRGLGRLRRLQAAAGSDVRSVRARPLSHVHHRGDIRACRSTRGIRRRRSSATSLAWWRDEPRRGQTVGAVLLRARQGAADARRAGERSRRRRSTCTARWRHDRGVPRGGHRDGAGRADHRGDARQGARAIARAGAALGARHAVDAAAAERVGRLSRPG